ncbi:hypothetical protein DVS77_08710 [Mycolicibacterium moriokaense]|nr:hypothetical protein DVS77_08710 [Mycolicibacterium moriokaense]
MAMNAVTPLMCTSAVISLVTAALAVAPAATARDCDWRLGPDMVLLQDNGLTVMGHITDNLVVGPVKYAHTGGDDWTEGLPQGPAGLTSPDKRTFTMTVNWTKGPGAGLSNTYTGRIGDDKRLLGTTTNSLGSTNGWQAQYSAFCDDPPVKDLDVTPGAPLGSGAAGAKPDTPKAPTEATVIADTDIYDKPDGNGQKIGTLSVGEVHPLMEPCRNDWCRVGQIELGGYDGLPNGTAWVYAKGFLTFS